MKKALIFITAFLIVGARPASKLEAARDTLSKGKTSLWDVKIEKKRQSDSFSKALAHYTMGIIYDNEGKLESAIAEYKSAIAVDPKVSYLHSRLGVDYFLSKNTDKAVEEFKTAKSLDPADTRPRFLLALGFTALNKFDLAQKEYEEIVHLNPNDIAALGSLADLFVVEEKMGEAATIYEKLIEKEKHSSLLYFNLGVVYSRLGKTDQAIAAFKEASRLEPNYLEAL